jgi:hypothetical protein
MASILDLVGDRSDSEDDLDFVLEAAESDSGGYTPMDSNVCSS